MKRDSVYMLILACECFGLDPRTHIFETEVNVVYWPWNGQYERVDRI